MSEQETARGVGPAPAVTDGGGGGLACPVAAVCDRAALVASVLPRAAVERWIWRGASGSVYEHTVTSLIGALPTGPASYVLVHRSAGGDMRVLAVGTIEDEAPTLNLAHLRREGATLGANEVHLWAVGASARERSLAAQDIAAAVIPGVHPHTHGGEPMSFGLCA